MDFQLSEEEQLLADSVGRMIEKDYDFEARKAITKSEAGYTRSSGARWPRWA